MSFLTQLEQAVLAVARVAVPALADADHQHLGEIAHTDIPPGAFPFAYNLGFSRSQTSSASGIATTYDGALVVVSDRDLEHVRSLAEAIATALEAEPTIGGLLTSMLVSLDSFPDPATDTLFVAALVLEMTPSGSAGSGTGAAVGAISWKLKALVDLVTTTPDAWESDREAAIMAVLGAGAARFASDLADPPVEAVPAGNARFSLVVIAAPVVISSNVTGVGLAIELRVFRTLATGATERSYTASTMFAEMLALASPAFWIGAFGDARTPDKGAPEISDLTR